MASFMFLDRQWATWVLRSPAVDFGIVEDHAWASTVRSARNPAQSSATMGRRRLLQPGRSLGRGFRRVGVGADVEFDGQDG
ncbi:MAG: hypothetical protein F4X12_20170 [Acidobacteriia bacterium]|nr:hypothetical protein [Terriglobia bacterium]